MKHFFFSMLLLSNAAFCQTNYNAHFGAGVVVGAGVASLNCLTPKQSVIWGTAAGLLAGFSKEVSDYATGNYFSKQDMYYSAFGGLFGSLAVAMIKKHVWPNKYDKQKPFAWSFKRRHKVKRLKFKQFAN